MKIYPECVIFIYSQYTKVNIEIFSHLLLLLQQMRLQWTTTVEWKYNIVTSCRAHWSGYEKKPARVPCVYLVERENLLHLFIHCDCNSELHSISMFSSASEGAIVRNSTFAIHILWCGSLLDDSCLSGHRFIVAIGWGGGMIKEISGPGLDKHGWKPQNAFSCTKTTIWQECSE